MPFLLYNEVGNKQTVFTKQIIEMKKQKHKMSSGKMSERMSLLEFLKERSGIRLSKLEAYLDLVEKASVQYIPKDLCKQEFCLSNGQFVITITELAGCWHWHRATVRTFIEQLEKMNQISVTRLTKSQIITIPMLAETPAVSPIDAALDVFRQKMRTALDEWRSGKMSASACASECEQLYEDATEEVAIILQKADNGNSIGKVPCGSNIPESVGHAFCMTALTAVCEATFHQVLGQETDNTLATSLLSFFSNDLGGDWLSFIEAAKAISELALDGSSSALQQESAAIKSQFQSLCRPFLAIIANQEVSCPTKGSNDL